MRLLKEISRGSFKNEHRVFGFKSLKLVIAIVILTIAAFISFKAISLSVWDGKHTLNYVQVGQEIVILSYHPQENILNRLSLPSDAFLTVSYGLGDYKVGKLFDLGEQEGMGGAKLIKDSLQFLVGVPLDGWEIQKNNKKGFKLFRESNFSRFDQLRIWWRISRLVPHNIRDYNLGQGRFVTLETLADGSSRPRLEKERIEEYVLPLLGDSTILNEDLRVEVINGTDKKLLAKMAAILIRGMGGQVVKVSNSEDRFSQTALFFLSEKTIKDSFTLSKLKNVFKPDRVEEKTDQEMDIVLIIGETFYKDYFSNN